MRRYQTAIDLRNALDDLKVELQSGEFEGKAAASPQVTTAPERARPQRSAVPFAAAAVVAALAFGFGVWWGGRDAAPSLSALSASSSQPAPVRLTSPAGLAGAPSWSPEGDKIVYAADVAGNMDLWLQEADGGRTEELTSLDGNETDPDWAPDDTAVAYTRNFGNDGISLISPYGGQPSPLTQFGSHPKWSPDSSKIVFQWRGDVWIVGTGGRRPGAAG